MIRLISSRAKEVQVNRRTRYDHTGEYISAAARDSLESGLRQYFIQAGFGLFRLAPWRVSPVALGVSRGHRNFAAFDAVRFVPSLNFG